MTPDATPCNRPVPTPQPPGVNTDRLAALDGLTPENLEWLDRMMDDIIWDAGDATPLAPGLDPPDGSDVAAAVNVLTAVRQLVINRLNAPD